jgi:hypothetical protein
MNNSVFTFQALTQKVAQHGSKENHQKKKENQKKR